MKQMTKYHGREVVFIASYGSVNYGTNDETSDNDYKVFLMPTFEDLYKGKMFSSNVKIDGDDYEFHDVRKLETLFYKANPSYLEILVAKETWVNPKYKSFWKFLMNNKYKLSKMNMKSYYKAINGVMMQKYKAIEKDLPNSQENEGYKRRVKFGFDTKQLLHVIRYAQMRNDVFLNEKNPLSVIDLKGTPATRHNLCNDKLAKELLDIKKNKGNLTKEDALVMAKEYMESMDGATEFGVLFDGTIEEYINTLEVDEETNKKLHDNIMKLVKRGFE